MAPGITEVAIKYRITDPTLLALTLSIFLLSFAFGVCNFRAHKLVKLLTLIQISAFNSRTAIRDVRADMGMPVPSPISIHPLSQLTHLILM